MEVTVLTWIISAAGLLIVALVVWSVRLFHGERTLRVPAERIRLETVTRGEFQEYIPVTATVVPLTTHYLSATEGGRVVNIERGQGYVPPPPRRWGTVHLSDGGYVSSSV